MADDFNIRQLRKEIEALSDESYRSFHEGLCKTTKYKINGVRLPELRRLAKEIIKSGNADKMMSVQPDCYEEVMIKALVIAGERIPLEKKLPEIEAFIPEIDNWAVCDTFSSTLKPKSNELGLLLDFVKSHIFGDYEYEIRLSVVLMLNYLIKQEYIDEILILLSKTDCSYYYTSMAVAWALSFCYIGFRDKTLVLLKSGKIDGITLKRTEQKIRDSYRVSKADKELLKRL